MSLQIEKLEKNMAKLTIEVPAEELDQAIQKAYEKQKNQISVPGFRKGKVPRAMVEKMYGVGIFYEEAANILIPEAYTSNTEDIDLEIVSQPTIDVVQIEKGKPFIFTAEVAVKPEVTLGAYKGIEVEVEDTEVKEEEIDAEIDKERENNARILPVEDRAVESGDMITLDFEGFVDGTPFDGGKAEDYELTIGSGAFIPGFEEQLVGVEIGTEVDVNVTFPEEYQAEDLAGKPAVFKCTVKSIKVKELPVADDDFAKDVSEFDTMDEYRADVKAKIAEKKEEHAKAMKEDAVIGKIIENASMDIPEPMIDLQVRNVVEDFARRIQAQGLSLEQYMQFTGLDQAKLLEQMRPQAITRIQSRLVLEAIVEAENIQVADEKLEEEISKMAEMYKMEVEELKDLIKGNERKQMKMDLAIQDAVKIVVDSAVEK